MTTTTAPRAPQTPLPRPHALAPCAVCGQFCTTAHHATRAGTVDDVADAHHDPRPEAR